MEITEATPEQQITSAFREATAKFQQNAPVLNHLNARWAITKGQLGSVANHLENWSTPALQREAMVAARNETLQGALVFFSGWRDTAIEDGAAVLYSQTLPPQPDPPNSDQIIEGALSVLRNQRAIVFRTEGVRLVVHPASKLTAAEREFIAKHKERIHAKVVGEEDAWRL